MKEGHPSPEKVMQQGLMSYASSAALATACHYSIFSRIEKGAARSDAYQANRNLVLSDHAKATSIPMLEIDNNDVRCTHGATVGPVDPQHLFYLRSRGIPETTAKRMIVQGFFGDVLERIPFEHARRLIETELEARLG